VLIIRPESAENRKTKPTGTASVKQCLTLNGITAAMKTKTAIELQGIRPVKPC